MQYHAQAIHKSLSTAEFKSTRPQNNFQYYHLLLSPYKCNLQPLLFYRVITTKIMLFTLLWCAVTQKKEIRSKVVLQIHSPTMFEKNLNLSEQTQSSPKYEILLSNVKT